MWKPEYGERRKRKYHSDPEYRARVRASGRPPEENKEYMRSYYAENKDGWNKRTPEQREKYLAARRERYANDPELRARIREQNRKYADDGRKRGARIKREFGVTDEQYNSMLQRQDGGCAICGKPEADTRGHKLHIDHCHDTGLVRGLLCASCNTGIGKFRDNISFLDRAIEYLLEARQRALAGVVPAK